MYVVDGPVYAETNNSQPDISPRHTRAMAVHTLFLRVCKEDSGQTKRGPVASESSLSTLVTSWFCHAQAYN